MISNSIHIISLAPKFAVSVCEFHISPFLEYDRRTLSFQISHPISTPVEQINQTQQKTGRVKPCRSFFMYRFLYKPSELLFRSAMVA